MPAIGGKAYSAQSELTVNYQSIASYFATTSEMVLIYCAQRSHVAGEFKEAIPMFHKAGLKTWLSAIFFAA